MAVGSPKRWSAGQVVTAADRVAYISDVLDDLAGRNGPVELENSVMLATGRHYLDLPTGSGGGVAATPIWQTTATSEWQQFPQNTWSRGGGGRFTFAGATRDIWRIFVNDRGVFSLDVDARTNGGTLTQAAAYWLTADFGTTRLRESFTGPAGQVVLNLATGARGTTFVASWNAAGDPDVTWGLWDTDPGATIGSSSSSSSSSRSVGPAGALRYSGGRLEYSDGSAWLVAAEAGPADLFAGLERAGDVGSGATQVARGNHTH